MEGLVPDDESVRLLSHELEDLDYLLLYQAYSAKGRNPAVASKTMSKRKKRCSKQDISKRENLDMMWKQTVISAIMEKIWMFHVLGDKKVKMDMNQM